MDQKPTYEELEQRVQESEQSEFKLKRAEEEIAEKTTLLNNILRNA